MTRTPSHRAGPAESSRCVVASTARALTVSGGAAECAGHRRDGGLVDRQAPQHERRAASGRGGTGAGQPAAVVAEDLAVTAIVDTAVARQPDPQLERMPDDRYVGDGPL